MVVSQTSNEDGCIQLTTKKFDSDEYTYKVRARKNSGNEGFLIVFNYVDKDNYCWINFGGWGNTQHGVEQVIKGGKQQIATCPGRVETGRWYDVELHVKGDSIYASLDGKQVFATRLKGSIKPGLYQTASLDKETGEVIVKLANTSMLKTTARVHVNGLTPTTARVIRLTSASGNDENSLEEPTKVYPTEQQLSPEDGVVEVTLPASSLNIIRMK
mgnify:FL=1